MEAVTLSPASRARISNDLTWALPGTDGRGAWARRRRDLVKAVAGEIGRPLTERDRVLVSNAAAIAVRVEQLSAQIAAGEPVDDEALVRLSNTLARLLASLGIEEREQAA